LELTVPGAVACAAREFGNAEAVASPGGPRLSYRELDERVAAVTGALIDAGIEPGDRIALWAPNDACWVLIALGALGAGATLVPVSTRFTGPEALDVIGRSGARALFVAGGFLGVDRLGTLLAAADESGAGDGLDRLGLTVRVPDEWDVCSWRRVRWRRRGGGPGPCGRGTSATSCSPRARPGGARAR
jgi:HIP---CoA ligase